MPNLRPVPIGEHQFSSWQNLIQRTVQAQNVVAGSGLVASTSDPNFTRISIPFEADPIRMTWKGNFDEFASYNVNDIVRVIPNVNYIDPETGETLPIGSTSEIGHPFAPLSLGLFICTKFIPPSFADENFFSDSIKPMYDKIVPDDVQDGIRWTRFNVYYPMYPEPPTANTASVDTGYGFNIIANDTFWQAMPFGTMPMKVCVDGVAKQFYIVGAESGSVFNTDYLAYQAPT